MNTKFMDGHVLPTANKHIQPRVLCLKRYKTVILAFYLVWVRNLVSNIEVGRSQLKCDGTRAESRFLLLGETDGSI